MSEYISNKIIGTWELVSWVSIDENKKETDAFGDNPSGILMYSDSGYMNAQLMKSKRANFSSEILHSGTSEEIVKAYQSYACYYGKFFEHTPGKLTHVVEGSLFPNWVGQDEIRYARIKGEHLYLSTPPITVDNKIIFYEVNWKRVN